MTSYLLGAQALDRTNRPFERTGQYHLDPSSAACDRGREIACSGFPGDGTCDNHGLLLHRGTQGNSLWCNFQQASLISPAITDSSGGGCDPLLQPVRL